MKIAALVGLGLVLLMVPVAGCRWPLAPEIGSIHGTVRFWDGTRANLGYVSIRRNRTWERTSFGRIDYTGRYALFPGGVVGDTVIVDAWDYCTGTCGSTNWGFVKIVLRRSPVVVDIVMNLANDI